jgi:hypothetical protein
MATKRKTPPARMTTDEAADYLGMTPEDLLRSRWRGMEPGSLGYKEGGVLYFRKGDLPKPKRAPKDDPEVEGDG